MKINPHTLRVGLVYFLLLTGAAWHALGVLQRAMRLLAAPMMFALALLLLGEYLCKLRRLQTTTDRNLVQRFAGWGSAVILAGFLVELVGVHTGRLFGHYHYQGVLQPEFAGVPLVIGFAWLTMLLSSAALAQRFLKAGASPGRSAAGIAAFMVLFDLFMEPAAMALGYWHWQEGVVPLQNYAAWFGIGCLLAHVGLRLGVLQTEFSSLPRHAYLAQLLYFTIVNLSH
ncbi:MAG: carotenoid biosynthesis protein [candidate division KSB1 bacterium]|nr:carotenoid biosynthesis protein [candidate division KSB1 bacterium]MDZ7272645.1 carotenoid biosynthesis protein [candidate division KSB1 bacterium]MDZ7284333.1 carotenoid biosynthesis protein [candidate division KSB1 bacterium]MDZ7297271.1 carotenoid biosynthesis protein [candidate division KSB1 bacterium]MDZ7309044.1 carotenoid biosynthesis protein [candidate division KSB1 bacterium]